MEDDVKELFLLTMAIGSQLSAITPDAAIDQLKEGNTRYVTGQLLHPNRDEGRRSLTVEKQEPFAVILGCSDSRVSPEIVFDQGIGDLFIVRVAGNVSGPIELDSIEFAALTFHSSVIVVLGHKNCGAVKAVVDGDTQNIEAVAELIEPAVKIAKNLPGDTMDNAVKQNIILTAEQLKKSPVISKLIAEKKIKVVGGYYDLESGKVTFLE